MSDQTDLVSGPYRIDALGDVTIIARGSSMNLMSAGSMSDLTVESAGLLSIESGPAIVSLDGSNPARGMIDITAGALGSITQNVGPPKVGPRIKMTPTEIELAVGPPGMGTSIKLTAGTITLKMGAVSYELNPVGHTLKAAGTQVDINVAGVMTRAPVVQENVDGVLFSKSGLRVTETAGPHICKAGIEMMGGG